MSKTRNNSTVLFQHQQRMCVGDISVFIKCEENVFAVIQKYESIAALVPFEDALTNPILLKYRTRKNDLCHHIKEIVEGVACMIPAQDILKKCILMKIESSKFISIPPNLLEHS